jgi:plastocyanin
MAFLSIGLPALAVEPGVDIAVPRVAVSTVGTSLSFNPARLVVEQADHVRWSATAASIHTTTSGANCLADGLWNASLGTAGTNFTRQFNEPPQTFPYFCSPHCGLGMVGQVTVTTLIDVAMTHAAGTSKLTWTGGSGLYQVFRSGRANFVGPGIGPFPPDGGDAGTSFTDASFPPEGTALFFLVMNKP